MVEQKLSSLDHRVQFPGSRVLNEKEPWGLSIGGRICAENLNYFS